MAASISKKDLVVTKDYPKGTVWKNLKIGEFFTLKKDGSYWQIRVGEGGLASPVMISEPPRPIEKHRSMTMYASKAL